MRTFGWLCVYLACAFVGAAGLQSLQAKTLTLLPLRDVATAFGGSLGLAQAAGSIPCALPLLCAGLLLLYSSSRNRRLRIFGPRRRRF